MVGRKIKKMLNRIRGRAVPLALILEKGSDLKTMDNSLIHAKGEINVDNSSKLSIGKSVQIDAKLFLKNRASLQIADQCRLKNITINIQNNGEVIFGEGCIFNPPDRFPMQIDVNDGKLFFEGKNNVMANILVRFKGQLTIGKYTGIGFNSEVRCEESITIGKYGLFSYEICLYDTDTHSTDWEKRRERIEAGYPFGAGEIKRPNTKPVIIGDDVWIGKGATVTKGAMIGNKCIVGIRTVVGGGTFDDETTIISNKPRTIQLKKNE
jgi:acetyltransferase-like isoleucine patch superfamily enzyme